MIIQDLSGVHSMGMYNSRCTKFPMAVLAKYIMVKIRIEDDYADGTSSSERKSPEPAT